MRNVLPPVQLYKNAKTHFIDTISKKMHLPRWCGQCVYYCGLLFLDLQQPFIWVMDQITGRINRKTLHTLCIAAIAKNESEYIREWVEYHKAIGVDKIFLYDNDSNDDMLDKIKDFIAQQYVQVIPFSGKAMQNKAYRHALQHFGNRTTYMAIIDCDEFIVPLNKNESLKNTIDALFASRKNVAAVGINWQMFGSNGHVEKPEGKLIEAFTAASLPERGGNDHVKVIVMPRRCTIYPANPHEIVLKLGFIEINTQKEIMHGPHNQVHSYVNIKINHYFTKSLEQWKKRRALGTADGINVFRAIQEFDEYDYHDITDTSAIDALNWAYSNIKN